MYLLHQALPPDLVYALHQASRPPLLLAGCRAYVCFTYLIHIHRVVLSLPLSLSLSISVACR